ncbi:MAG: hypothetical protein R3E01_03010 [Pirellulaceae bacterium]
MMMSPLVRFRYPQVAMPGPASLADDVDLAIATVYQCLQKLDLKAIGLSEYNQRYLQEKLVKPEYEFSILHLMLTSTLHRCNKDRKELTFVDFGAGSGIACFAAKALGIGSVVYSDIYDVSAKDASLLGEQTGYPADHYVVGDLPVLAQYLRKHRLTSDAFISHDVIEHVYDMQDMFQQLSQMMTLGNTLWLSSAANPLRPRTRRTLAALANRYEHTDRSPQWGDKQRDANKAYLSIRREMIRDMLPTLPPEQLETLARHTRGLRQDDIQVAVDRFRDTGEMPAVPEHPTNTCDPWTGNWAERLMDPYQLVHKLSEFGFDMHVLPGYWAADPKNASKNLAKRATNFAMQRIGRLALRHAPYYILFGTRS